MSKPRLLLLVSLICNAILVAWGALPEPPPAGATSAAAAGAEPSATGLAAWFAKLAPSRDPTSPSTPQKVPDAEYSEAGWTRSLYDDVAELREHGVDDAIVRMLALAEAERLFRERALAVLAPRQRTEYWESRQNSQRVDPAQLAVFQRLRRERVAAIAELIGPDTESSERNTPQTFMAAPLGTLDYLPSAKRLALSEYLEASDNDFRANMSPLGRLRRAGAPVSGTGYAEHELARDAQIRLILGPTLYDEYLRRSSQTARRLRYELAGLNPTRAEFDALVAIEHEQRTRRAEILGYSPGPGPGKVRAMADQRTDSVRAALGEQRYAEYERTRDQAFMTVHSLARELELEPDVARSSFELIEQARAKVQALMGGSNVRDPKTLERIDALRRELHRQVAERLGLEGLSEGELNQLLVGVDVGPPGVSFARGR